MSGLQALQQRFQAFLLHAEPAVREQVVNSGCLNREQRLDIYADAYRTRLIEVLAHDFPGLEALLGEQAFRAMARAYIENYPSRHFSVRWFGKHLSVFLAEYPRYADQPILMEMAAFEWALSAALDAADAPRLGFEELVAVPSERWPELCFDLHPSVGRLDLYWNVPPLWKAVDAGEPPQKPECSEAPQPWVIWRNDLASYFYSMAPDEAWALDAVRVGRSFAEICEGLCEWQAEEQVAAHAASLLRNWLGYGLIVALR